MSKISLMGSGAFDVYCPTKRVYWRPVTDTTVLKVGQPVCYNSDSVQDHKERTADPTHLGLTKDTYAEGEQEFTGRLFIVEEPLTANLMSFAGIVKSLGPEAGADGDMIEIFVPTEGAIVPARINASVTLDSSILGIVDSGANLISGGRPIGIAGETIDRGTDAGMCWIKLSTDKFIHQSGVASTLLTGLVVNTLQHTFINTSGTACNVMIHTTCSGALASAHNSWGALIYLAMSAAITAAGYERAILGQLNAAGATFNHGSLNVFGIHAQLHGAVTNTEVSQCAALAAEWSLSEAPNTGKSSVLYLYAAGAENVRAMINMSSAGEQCDYIFDFNGLGGESHSTVIKKGGTGGMWTNTGAWVMIKCSVDGTDYYIPAGVALTEA